MGNKQIWEYKEHFHAIGMTGDYDGYYEVTNGNISLCTNDDPEDITETENTLQNIAKALNESGCKFYCNTTTEHKLHVENMELRYKMDELKERCDKMEAALEDIASQHKSNEWEEEGDTEHGYDCLIDVARIALAGYRNLEGKKEGENE
jgi:hypothetical protein